MRKWGSPSAPVQDIPDELWYASSDYYRCRKPNVESGEGTALVVFSTRERGRAGTSRGSDSSMGSGAERDDYISEPGQSWLVATSPTPPSLIPNVEGTQLMGTLLRP